MLTNKKSVPRVSLLIPCYQSAEYVEDAIVCALAQTYGHIEIIVAPDDGSTYRHLRESFKSPQIRIIPPGSVARTGAGATRNRALDAASGEYIALLDADDLIPDRYIEDLMSVAIVEGAAVAGVRYLDWASQEPVRIPPMHNRHLSLSGFSQLLASLHPLIHRSMEVGYCGGFAEDVVHDAIVFARLGTVQIVESVTYDARLRAGSECNSGIDAEALIQREYQNRIDQALKRPTEIGIQCLNFQDRNDFADLFMFRSAVSKEFSVSGASCYNRWVAGREADLWDKFSASRFATLSSIEL